MKKYVYNKLDRLYKTLRPIPFIGSIAELFVAPVEYLLGPTKSKQSFLVTEITEMVIGLREVTETHHKLIHDLQDRIDALELMNRMLSTALVAKDEKATTEDSSS